MTVLTVVSDSFNRANSGTLGTADSGQAWTNTQGAWGVTSNKAMVSGASNNLAVIPGVGASDMIVSATFTTYDNNNTAGLMGRCSDLFANAVGGGTAYWGLAKSTAVFIFSSVNGTNTQLATLSLAQGGSVLGLTCAGSAISLQNNGSTVLSVTDSAVTVGANAGLFKFSTAGSTTADDFNVQAILTPPRRLYAQAVRRASVY